MKYISRLIVISLLSAFLFSCGDGVDIPAENRKHSRLKRFYHISNMAPVSIDTSYTDFFYNGSGRLDSLTHFAIDRNGTPILKQHTIIYYDSKGRAERERTDGIEARSVRYGYDSQDRIQNIWFKTDGIPGFGGYHYKYDSNGAWYEELFYDLNANGDSTAISRHHYKFDSNKNIESSIQSYSSTINPPSTRAITYKYDDKLNPFHNISAFIFRSLGNSQNNLIETSVTETYSQSTRYVYTYNYIFNHKYENGLLVETANGKNKQTFVYETYQVEY